MLQIVAVVSLLLRTCFDIGILTLRLFGHVTMTDPPKSLNFDSIVIVFLGKNDIRSNLYWTCSQFCFHDGSSWLCNVQFDTPPVIDCLWITYVWCFFVFETNKFHMSWMVCQALSSVAQTLLVMHHTTRECPWTKLFLGGCWAVKSVYLVCVCASFISVEATW